MIFDASRVPLRIERWRWVRCEALHKPGGYLAASPRLSGVLDVDDTRFRSQDTLADSPLECPVGVVVVGIPPRVQVSDEGLPAELAPRRPVQRQPLSGP